MATLKLILASGSPRRRDLLRDAGYQFAVVVPDDSAECGTGGEKDPAAVVAKLAYQKAANVAERGVTGLLVACDTLAECRGQMLGKPTNEADARRMLCALSGCEHRVFSGVCVWQLPGGKPDVRVAITTLRMDELSSDRIDQYLATGQWVGKAGAFGYQDELGWVHVVEGSESNVVGLPLELFGDMLAAAGYTKSNSGGTA